MVSSQSPAISAYLAGGFTGLHIAQTHEINGVKGQTLSRHEFFFARFMYGLRSVLYSASLASYFVVSGIALPQPFNRNNK